MGRDEVILLDTHVLIWVANEDRKLGRQARAALDRAWKAEAVGVCPISFWEVATLAARKRIRLPMSAAAWRASLLAAGLSELPLDGGVALRAVDLAGLPADPADRLIVATALCYQAELMTAADALLEWRHGLPRVDARL